MRALHSVCRNMCARFASTVRGRTWPLRRLVPTQKGRTRSPDPDRRSARAWAIWFNLPSYIKLTLQISATQLTGERQGEVKDAMKAAGGILALTNSPTASMDQV